MGVLSTPLIDEARAIFTELGYEVESVGSELRAERKWRIVYISEETPTTVDGEADLRCFVADPERAPELRAELLSLEPDYDWAVMSVESTGDYEVLHPEASEGLPS
ncbi:DUF7116 family protein [Halomarina oriensis]|uniref:Uncharacterized protein n=1 Tax=Halomarina oriensis TaxID=671145 RepID=A0A6B0GWD5_9EURY|nr:hypothetical protein [Halomarina oriensis]MWG36048.1 hypothetical protein [Halomarina oriensis]